MTGVRGCISNVASNYKGDVTLTTLLLVTGLPGCGKTTIAESVAADLNASVIGHDWVMAGLRVHPTVWNEIEELDRVAHRSVGWTIMWNLGLAQLRMGRSIILDGVARAPEISRTRAIAQEVGARSLVALCSAPTVDIHRERIVGRVRNIPEWPELIWEDVENSRHTWEAPNDVDLVLDPDQPLATSSASLRSLLETGG